MQSALTLSSRRIVLALAAGSLLSAACHPHARSREAWQSSNPLDRIDAIIQATEARSPDAVPALVGLLQDRDRAVRLYAILALEKLTGQTYGYQYYAHETERRAAVIRWQEALRQGRVLITPAPPNARINSTSHTPPTAANDP